MGVRLRGAVSLGLAGALVLAVAWSTATANTEGKTTVEQTIVPPGEGAFSPLALAAGEPYLERGEGIGVAQPGRAGPAAVAPLLRAAHGLPAGRRGVARARGGRRRGGPAARRRLAAHRGPRPAHDRRRDPPGERLRRAEPGGRLVRAPGADGVHARDRRQRRQPAAQRDRVGRPAARGREPDPEQRGRARPRSTRACRTTTTTRVPDTSFYDPDSPQGMWSAFPTYPGLLDRAQQGFQAAGPRRAVLRDVRQPRRPRAGQPGGQLRPSRTSPPAALKVVRRRAHGHRSPRIRRGSSWTRRSTSSSTGRGPPPTATASGWSSRPSRRRRAGAAGYYAFSPRPGFRFISLDTVCDGGVAGASADGNVDDPQFRWLERAAARRRRARRADRPVQPPRDREPDLQRHRRGRRPVHRSRRARPRPQPGL